jgi:uncharacterized membrane protein
MDRMLVVVFDTENKAYEGKKALSQLEDEGSIVVYADAVIGKNPDGTTTLKESEHPGALGTLAGTALGSLLGLIGGPLGIAIGAGVGLVAGGALDLKNARVGADFIDDVKLALQPGRFAVVADIQEDWTSPVDSRMEALGGVVYRRALSDVKRAIHEEHVAAMQAELAQMRAEQANAHADRKAKLQEKTNQLDAKIQVQLEKDKEQRQAAEREAKAKVEILKAKSAALKVRAAQKHA